jgi:hypothetical protein
MTFITQKHLPRRAFLRGLGTTLALPLLDSMAPAMAGTKVGKPPVRLGFVYVPNGIIPGAWTPSTEGKDFSFNRIMQPLEAYRENLVVLSGLAQVNGRSFGSGGGDHARAGATWLTGVHPKKTGGFGIQAGVSADQIAAQELGKSTEFASLELSIDSPSLAGSCDSGYSCAYTNTISWRSETTPLPMEVNPRVVFERLFGDGQSTDPAARLKALQEQRSILDYLAGSLDRIETKLGQSDRRKLTEYLEAIRDIERRIQKAEERNAAVEVPLINRPSAIPEDLTEHMKLMMDLQVIAFQADLTRVITFMMGREGSNRSYRHLGVPDGHHNCTHHQNDPEKIEKTTLIDTYHVQMFSYMVEKLKATPDGDGSLLDHSMILYGSSLSDGNNHLHDNLPLVLVGGGAGSIKGGRHVKYAGETPMNNLLLTMLETAGVQTSEKFGDSTGKVEHLSV